MEKTKLKKGVSDLRSKQRLRVPKLYLAIPHCCRATSRQGLPAAFCALLCGILEVMDRDEDATLSGPLLRSSRALLRLLSAMIVGNATFISGGWGRAIWESFCLHAFFGQLSGNVF